MSEANEVIPPPVKDRSTGLVVFGVIQVCLGALVGLLAIFTLLGTLMLARMGDEITSAMGGTGFGQMIAGALVYAVMAAWFIVTGIGSMLARRWARALILVYSCIWLISGLFGLAYTMFFMGDIIDQVAADGQMPTSFAATMKIFTLVFLLVFYVAIPGALFFFYRATSVRQTCEFRNPAPSWTDACPLPVLAHGMLFYAMAASVLFTGAYQWVFPFFGVLLSGPSGAVMALVTAVAAIGLAWGAYKLRPWAWWGSGAFVAVWCVSTAYTFTRVGLVEFYERMGMSEQQLASMRPMIESGMFERMLFIGVALWAVAFLILLLYTRRFYKVAEATGHGWPANPAP